MDLQSLRGRLSGTMVQRADAAYAQVRRSLSWNTYLSPGNPAAIVRVASDRDVIAAVEFARTHDLQIAISGGGHGLCGAAPSDDALLLDLSGLGTVSIDAAARRASVGPVVRNRDLANQLGAHGLAFPYGHCSTVALSGYVLSGGFGWNSGEWGPACFSVEAIDVVLADGSFVTATDTQHPDVLWAARGGGAAFFGIVTRYRIAVYRQPVILTSTFVYPLAQAVEVGAWLWQRRADFPAHLEVMVALTGAPPGVTGRDDMACIVSAAAFAASADEAGAALALLEDCPAIDRCQQRTLRQPASFTALFDGMDRMFPAQHRYLAHTAGSMHEPATLLAAIEPHVRRAPSPQALILCPIMAPPPAGAPAPPPAAFSIAPRTFMMAYAVWPDAGTDAAARAWHDAAVDALEPLTNCYYIGETEVAARPERAARCFSPESWERMQRLRRRYDPDGLFRSLVAR